MVKSQTAKHVGPTNQTFTTRILQPKDLGAVIFGCTNNTFAECHSRQLFGLPKAHLSYVRNIKEGLPLFLFNYDDRRLHGIYEAASNGKFCPQSNAWSRDGKGKTGYPAQVAMRVRVWCFPLAESQFRNAILTNYYQRMPGFPGQKLRFFQFELDHAQTHALLDMFTPLPSPNNVWTSLVAAPGHEPVRKSVLPPVWTPECEGNNDLKSEKVVKSDADMVKKKKIEEVGTGGVNTELASSCNEPSNGSDDLDCGDTPPEKGKYALSNNEAKVQQQQSGQQDKELSFKPVSERLSVLSPQQCNSDFCANATATEGIDAYSCKDVQEVKRAVLDGHSNLPENLDAEVDLLVQSSCTEAKMGNACRTAAVNKLSPQPPAITHQFQATERQLMQVVYQTLNTNDVNSASGAAIPSQEPVRDDGSLCKGRKRKAVTRGIQISPNDDSLCKGRKRKATTQAIQRSPNDQHDIVNTHPTELPSPDYVSCYVKDRLAGNTTCMVCGEEGHYTCECPMKHQVKKVICTLCNKAGHCHLWCCRQNVSENHACQRCGEKGHYANKDLSCFGEKYTHNRDLSCSSCDTNHPFGKCPMSKITCFLCEGKDHVPVQCRLSPMLTAVTQYHQENFRATLKQAITETSRRTVALVQLSRESEPHDESHECQFKRDNEMVPKLSDFSHSSKQRCCERKSPIRSLVSYSDNANRATLMDKALARVSRNTCFNCHAEGHYANRCPNKKPPGELELYDVTCSSFHANKSHKKKKMKKLEELELCFVTCFNCDDKGHYSYSCPKNKPPRELEPYDGAHECHYKGNSETVPRVSSFNHGNSEMVPRVSSFNHGKQGQCDRKSPIRTQVPAPEKTNPEAITDVMQTKVTRIPCFNCHEEGHHAKRCPKKAAPRKLDLCDVTCFYCNDSHYTIRCPKKNKPGELELSGLTCFNCHDKGHYRKYCPKKNKPGELEPYDDSRECQFKGDSEMVPEVSRFSCCEQDPCDRKSPIRSLVSAYDKTNPATTMDGADSRAQAARRICYNCRDIGHYANRCPNKKLNKEHEE